MGENRHPRMGAVLSNQPAGGLAGRTLEEGQCSSCMCLSGVVCVCACVQVLFSMSDAVCHCLHPPLPWECSVLSHPSRADDLFSTSPHFSASLGLLRPPALWT